MGLLATFLCLLGITLLPSESAIIVCKSYSDISGDYHDVQQCGYSGSNNNLFCCGDCNKRYCCSHAKRRLTEEEQDRCPQRRTSKMPYIIGAVVGSLLPIIICVGLIICFVSPCCLLYKKCRGNHIRNRRPQNVINATTETTLITSPGHPQSSQGGHVPVYPIMPLQPGYGVQPMPQGYGTGLSMPSAPPPTYMELGGSGYSSPSGPYSHAAFSEGLPMYPLQAPMQPSEPTPDERDIPPSYNPSYSKNAY